MLLTWINLAYYQDLTAGLRAAIAAGRLEDFIAETKEGQGRAGVIDPGSACRRLHTARPPSSSAARCSPSGAVRLAAR